MPSSSDPRDLVAIVNGGITVTRSKNSLGQHAPHQASSSKQNTLLRHDSFESLAGKVGDHNSILLTPNARNARRQLDNGKVVRIKHHAGDNSSVDESQVRQLLSQASQSSSWDKLDKSMQTATPAAKILKKVRSQDSIQDSGAEGSNLDNTLEAIRSKNKRLLDLNDPDGLLEKQCERRSRRHKTEANNTPALYVLDDQASIASQAAGSVQRL